MIRKLVADTNIFLRFLLNDVPAQASEAEKYFGQAKEGKIAIVVLPITIFEIVFGLEKFYEKTRKETVELVKAVVSAPYLKVEDKEIFLEVLERYQGVNISLVDIFLFYKAGAIGGKVLSFDKGFERLEELES